MTDSLVGGPMDEFVRPYLKVPEDTVTARHMVDVVRLAIVENHSAGIASPTVVLGIEPRAQLLVSLLKAWPEWRWQAVSLPPLPESPLEDLSLVALRQLQEERHLCRLDDWCDEFHEPDALLCG